MKRQLTLAVALLLLLCGCAKKKRAPVAPAAPKATMPHVGDEEVGVASWYGYPYHGRPAANGEIYDMEKLTAAHRTLPFGTTVEVLNFTNDRTVDVRITDRGPFVDGRIIDLSKAAARQIGMLGPGTAKVRLRIAALPDVSPDGYFGVQVGAFRDRSNAERERARMSDRYGTARLVRRDGNPVMWRVVVGHEATIEGAGALAGRLRSETGPAIVVRVDDSASD